MLKLWDTGTGELKHDLTGEHTSQVLDVAFSPDGAFLASAGSWSDGNGVKLWDPGSGKVVRTIAVPNGHLRGGSCLSFAFSPEGKRMAMGLMQYDKSTDVTSGSIHIVYPVSGLLDLSWSVPLAVRPVAFSPDGKTVAAISARSTLALWDAMTGQPVREIPPDGHPVGGRWECFAFAPQTHMLAVGGIDAKERGFVVVWDTGGAAGDAH